MDPQLYKKEIDRLSNEINSFKETSEKKSFSILSYKYYFLIVILSGALTYLIKPKCILYIHKEENEDDEDEDEDEDEQDNKKQKSLQPNCDVEIKVSTKKFLLCWLLFATVSCISYYLFLLYKSKSK
jgi:flagellar biosynthesis/type III secretory pathway M-ring protein FliF/YscJ